MTDMELVSLLALAMALLNLYLVHQNTRLGKVIEHAHEIIIGVAKGEVELTWDADKRCAKPRLKKALQK